MTQNNCNWVFQARIDSCEILFMSFLFTIGLFADVFYFNIDMVCLESSDDERERKRKRKRLHHCGTGSRIYQELFCSLSIHFCLQQAWNTTTFSRQNTFKMNNEDFFGESTDLDTLLSDGNFSRILSQISFSNVVLNHDQLLNIPTASPDLESAENFDEWFASLPSTVDDGQLPTIDEDMFPGLTLVPDHDSQLSPDGEQPNEDSTIQQNVIITSNPILQQETGDIPYQMCPELSDHILGNMSVKQQPIPNYRSRYQCDGSRFLPASRYHPMSINVSFSHYTKFLLFIVFLFFSYPICDSYHCKAINNGVSWWQ